MKASNALIDNNKSGFLEVKEKLKDFDYRRNCKSLQNMCHIKVLALSFSDYDPTWRQSCY